jgi:phage terminase Nu1 subunit (DNA packaging protein)
MEQNVTKAEFARSVGVDKSYLTRLIKRGLPINQDGTVPKTAAARWYKANVVVRPKKTKEKAPRKSTKRQPEPETTPEAPPEPETEPAYDELPGEINRAEADRRLTLAKAELAELELLEARGILVEAGAVQEVWGAMISAAKARALLIPTSLAARIARESDPVTCEELLKQEIDQMLFELSEQWHIPER